MMKNKQNIITISIIAIIIIIFASKMILKNNEINFSYEVNRNNSNYIEDDFTDSSHKEKNSSILIQMVDLTFGLINVLFVLLAIITFFKLAIILILYDDISVKKEVLKQVLLLGAYAIALIIAPDFLKGLI